MRLSPLSLCCLFPSGCDVLLCFFPLSASSPPALTPAPQLYPPSCSAFETILTQLTTSRLGYKPTIVLMSSHEITHDIRALMERPAYRDRTRYAVA